MVSPHSLRVVMQNRLGVVQCTSDIVATLGQAYVATISEWSLYPT